MCAPFSYNNFSLYVESIFISTLLFKNPKNIIKTIQISKFETVCSCISNFFLKQKLKKLFKKNKNATFKQPCCGSYSSKTNSNL